jgi:hypothetical protein
MLMELEERVEDLGATGGGLNGRVASSLQAASRPKFRLRHLEALAEADVFV